jgi:hypothetical protein
MVRGAEKSTTLPPEGATPDQVRPLIVDAEVWDGLWRAEASYNEAAAALKQLEERAKAGPHLVWFFAADAKPVSTVATNEPAPVAVESSELRAAETLAAQQAAALEVARTQVEANFYERMVKGSGQAHGCRVSPTVESSKVPRAAWAYLRIRDWRLGTAVEPDGTIWYDVRIRPALLPPPPKEPPKTVLGWVRLAMTDMPCPDDLSGNKYAECIWHWAMTCGFNRDQKSFVRELRRYLGPGA